MQVQPVLEKRTIGSGKFAIVPSIEIIEKREGRKTADRILTKSGITAKLEAIEDNPQNTDNHAQLKEAIGNGFNIRESVDEFEKRFNEARKPAAIEIFLSLIIELELNGYRTKANTKKINSLLDYEEPQIRYMAIWYKKIKRESDPNLPVANCDAFNLIFNAIFDPDSRISEIAIAYIKTVATSENLHNRELVAQKIQEAKKQDKVNFDFNEKAPGGI